MPVDLNGEPLALLTIHAHPDDEASKGAGSVARYAAEGVRTVLVCCTGGEQGEILNPAMDTPEVRADLAGVRMRELSAAAEIIGYDEVDLLGYRDSGMPGTEANADPRSFASADLGEAVGRLVAVIRRVRPQVVVTYPADQKGYPHPDHLRVYEITGPAVEAAADPSASVGSGEPWRVSKIYYSAWSGARIAAMHEKFLELGLESPYDASWFERPSQDDRITTRVDTSGFADVRRRALIAHATQVDPTSRFWFGLPEDVADQVYPVDDYVLAWSDVGSNGPEDDLFAGVRGLIRDRRAMTVREVPATSSAASAPLASTFVSSWSTSSEASVADGALAAFLQSAELATVHLYETGAHLLTTPAVARSAAACAAHHRAHAAALATLAGSSAATGPNVALLTNLAPSLQLVSSEDDELGFLYSLEGQLAGTYEWAMSQFNAAPAVQQAATILPVECQHTVELGMLLSKPMTELVEVFQGQDGYLDPHEFPLP